MRRQRKFLGLLVALVVVSAGCAWSQVGYDSGHSFFNPVEPALNATSVKNLRLAWSANVDTGQWVVRDGLIYTTKTVDPSTPTVARAFNVSTGTEAWHTNVPALAAPKAVVNGLVYYDNGAVIAYDGKNGAPRWLTGGSYLAVDGTNLFTHVVNPDGSSKEVRAVSPFGNTLWSVVPGGSVIGAVVQNGNPIVLTFYKVDAPPHGVIVLTTYDAANGSILKRVSVPASATPGADVVMPAGAHVLSARDNIVYFVTGDRFVPGSTLFAANPDTGAVLWQKPFDSVKGLAVTPTALIVVTSFHDPEQVFAFNPKTGAQRWVAPMGPVLERPAVAGDLVFAGNTVYDLNTGAVITAFDNLFRGAVPSDGHLFIAGSTNSLQAMVPAS
jgi:hypothetical protein